MELGASLSEQVADRIRMGIIEGRFPPGERLTEGSITEWLNVSNNPVREALQLLEKEGLVIKEPRRGAYVRSFTEEDVRHLYMVRSALDGVAYRLLMENGALDGDLLDRLGKCIQDHEAAASRSDYTGSIEQDLCFHDLIYQGTGAEVLKSFWAILRAQFRVLLHWRNRSLSQHGARVGPSPMHHAIMAALQEGDLESLLAQTGRRYIENTEELARAIDETQPYRDRV